MASNPRNCKSFVAENPKCLDDDTVNHHSDEIVDSDEEPTTNLQALVQVTNGGSSCEIRSVVKRFSFNTTSTRQSKPTIMANQPSTKNHYVREGSNDGEQQSLCEL